MLDTNFILSHLSFIKDLLIELSTNANPIQILIPYIVLQELDGLKNCNGLNGPNRDAFVQESARKANDFLFKEFSSCNLYLRGQNMYERILKDPFATPDDLILDYCLYWKDKGCIVHLLSNDKNLCVKALVHFIGTWSLPNITVPEFISTILQFKPHELDRKDSLNPFQNQQIVLDSHDNHFMDIDDMEHDGMLFQPNHDFLNSITWQVIHFIHLNFSNALKILLSKVDGETQSQIPPQPWSLLDVFTIICLYHSKFTSPYLLSILKMSKGGLLMFVKDLERFKRIGHVSLTAGDLLLFINDVEKLFVIVNESGLEQEYSQGKISMNEWKDQLLKLIND